MKSPPVDWFALSILRDGSLVLSVDWASSVSIVQESGFSYEKPSEVGKETDCFSCKARLSSVVVLDGERRGRTLTALRSVSRTSCLGAFNIECSLDGTVSTLLIGD